MMADSFSSSQTPRNLLPRPPNHSAFPSEGDSRKRQRISTACDACRLSKSKCSGERPRCGSCVARDLECRYVTTTARSRLQALKQKCNDLESRSSPYEELFKLMKSLPKRDAQDIFERLRSGTDVETLLTHVVNGDLLLQLSAIPETRYRYDFPYISTMPASLVGGDNPYLSSLVYEAATVYPSSARPEKVTGLSTNPNSTSGPNTKALETTYVRPFHAAEVIEPRLSSMKLSSWTSVCDDDVLMRNLLKNWLQCEYHFASALQKDLFLQDMASKRDDFCSSLLVNVVLGYSCITYSRFKDRAQYWNPHTLTYRFIAEAKRLWELQADEPRITTIQAGILFNVFHNLCGLDEIGQAYRLQAIALANKMQLFSSNSVDEQSPRIRHGTAYTAWALYNWETLVGFSFMFAPLLKEPPEWKLPNPSNKPEWYGEVWIKYPLSNCLVPSNFGQIFKAKSQFRVIMNDACQVAYSEDSNMTLEQANKLLARLKTWYAGLTGPLLPKAIVLPGHLQLHMYYHHLILTMFKPLMDASPTPDPYLQRVVADATKYLQTVLRLYYLRHGYEAMDLFIVIPLVLTAYDCIDAINEQEIPANLESLRSTLILVAMGLYNQRRNHYLAEALFRVIRGRMRSSEAALFRGIMNIDVELADEKPDMAQAVRSHWPVSVVKKKDEFDSYILTNLVENYAHLNVERESSGTGSSTAGASS